MVMEVVGRLSLAVGQKRKRVILILADKCHGERCGWMRTAGATRLRYNGRALGNRVWKSSNPTHSGVTVTRTIEEIILPICSTHAGPCTGPK